MGVVIAASELQPFNMIMNKESRTNQGHESTQKGHAVVRGLSVYAAILNIATACNVLRNRPRLLPGR